MRRRSYGGRTLSAEQVAELYNLTAIEYDDAPLAERNAAIHRALAEHGYTPLDACRARFWLRRGKPRGYVWDDADAVRHWRLYWRL